MNADRLDKRLYSKRLGELSRAQFQAALDKFHLGTFLEAEPIGLGNFGQNVFLTSAQGAFVFRGAPFDQYQFPRECWFMRLLHERTNAPVPWPYLLDQDHDIFGWDYIIMPRMRGLQLADKEVLARLSDDERKSIAGALGVTLAEIHKLTNPVAGDYDLTTDSIKPLATSYGEHIIKEVRQMLARIETCTASDIVWVEEIIARAREALDDQFQPRCIMGDYKEDNVVVEESNGVWYVSGVFDLHGSFGDCEADLARPVAVYLDTQKPDLAREFLQVYNFHAPLRPGFSERFPLYMLKERLTIWEWAHNEQIVWWDKSLELREWLSTFTSAPQLLCQL